MPEIVKAIAVPAAEHRQGDDRVDREWRRYRRETYELTGDVTKIAAQVPALLAALSGMQMSELLSKVRLLGDQASKPGAPGGAIPPASLR